MKSAVLSLRFSRVSARLTRPSRLRIASLAQSIPRRNFSAARVSRVERCICPTVFASHNGASAPSAEEQRGNQRRWEESGNRQGSVDNWKWTLNWNEIMDNTIIGSCPRSADDIDCIAEESGATAILSVQSDLCLEALKIDYSALRDHGLQRGLMMTRVPIRDFDHGDQTLMLPEAVRTLALLTALNFKVYVHCTAGINRATLTVLGYLTFVQGWDLYSALKQIKKARPQANPYIDCWKNVKTRLLEGRSEEVIALSRKFFLKNETDSQDASFSNWVAAEDLVIKETFRRLLASSVDTMTALTDLKAESLCEICVNPAEIERANKEIENLQYELSIQRQRLKEATTSLEAQRLEHLEHHSPPTHVTQSYDRVNGESVGDSGLSSHPIDAPPTSLMVYDELVRVKEEVSALKKCIRQIAMVSTEALSIDSMDYDAEWEDEDDIIGLEEEDEDEEGVIGLEEEDQSED